MLWRSECEKITFGVYVSGPGNCGILLYFNGCYGPPVEWRVLRFQLLVLGLHWELVWDFTSEFGVIYMCIHPRG